MPVSQLLVAPDVPCLVATSLQSLPPSLPSGVSVSRSFLSLVKMPFIGFKAHPNPV